MTSARITYGLGNHTGAARALLRSEWPLADLPSCVNEPQFWTMTCPSFSGLAGIAVVVNGFKLSQAADEPRPYHPVLEYLVVGQQVRGRHLGRQLASHVLEETCKNAPAVIVEVEHERLGAVRFWTEHMQCTVLRDSEQTASKVLRLRWSPAGG
ncbi:GNAT family N-acetyltransferase [Streptomyces sp. NPDC058228]|uniref:GNAT family N-acetyltransferase n=1 Tax=unclassified Streptomyces TaxID=2593676 RepID=UPI0036E5D13E|nr:GNAT family N-acetyltransferase [Streptomyces sp. NBC_01602]